MTAVVPAHRCGTVPDFHRVPSFDASKRQTDYIYTISLVAPENQYQMWGYALDLVLVFGGMDKEGRVDVADVVHPAVLSNKVFRTPNSPGSSWLAVPM
jgi:hypothetical protein